MKGFQDPFFIYLTNNHTHKKRKKKKRGSNSKGTSQTPLKSHDEFKDLEDRNRRIILIQY